MVKEAEKSESALFHADQEWFAQHKHGLLKQYRGQFVAIVGGQVVDSDQDFSKLAQRFYGWYGYRDLYMPKVTEEVGPVRIPAPRALS